MPTACQSYLWTVSGRQAWLGIVLFLFIPNLLSSYDEVVTPSITSSSMSPHVTGILQILAPLALVVS